MRRRKGIGLICAAVLSAMVLSGCRSGGEAEWEDTLPVLVPETTVPTVVCETEEPTTTTPEVTIITSEKTKRTAATEATPELATTTAPPPTEATTTTVPTDIPNIPISEFTSSTALKPSDAVTATTTAKSESDTSTGSESTLTGVVEGDESGTETLTTEIDSLSNRYSADEIQRPYSYNQLTEKQQYIYDAVISAAERLKTDVNFSSVMEITSTDYCDVYQQIFNDEHALFYIDAKMQYAMNTNTKKLASAILFYKYSEDKIRSMQAEIEQEAAKVLDMITPEMTDYDKVKLFYDYLAENVVYDKTEENCRDIYGVFVKKKAICGGYSKAFSYLCDKVGIESLTKTGDADGEAHMWNMVKLGGQWYNIDITYAVTESALGKYVRYDYFCVTDEMLSSTRTVYDQTYTYPDAVAEEYNYYVKNGLIADSWEDARAMLVKQIGEASKTKQMVIQVKCSSKETYDDVIYRLFDPNQKQAVDIFEEALFTAENKYDCSEVNYSQDSTSMVVKLFLKYN